MEVKDTLNTLKWQLLARIPNGGIYERIRGAITNGNISEEDAFYYIYWKDISKSLFKKYIMGTYETTNEDYIKFFEWLNRHYLGTNCYQFNVDGHVFKLPIPQIKDYKCYKAEFLDLIMPYIKNQNTNLNEPFLEGPYEYNDVKLKSGSLVFDLGANYGLFSAYASSKNCNVYAFEPFPSVVNDYLNQTAHLSNNISVIPECISNIVGNVSFFLDYNTPSCSAIVNGDNNSSNVLVVKSNTIDNFVELNKLPRVDFIKADIEGAERLMLLGALKTLREFAPTLAICCYHKFDDIDVIKRLIHQANPRYEIVQAHKKIYARVK